MKLLNISKTFRSLPNREGRGWVSSDEQLMLRVGTGSDSAFEELYRRYARRLQGFFFRQLGGDEEAAADATHDTFLHLFEARDRYVEGRDFDTWLFTIAYNLCRNRYRRNAYEAGFIATLDAEPVSTEEIEIEMDRETLHQALANVLDNLPPPLRLLFSLRYEEELSVPQIASVLDIPQGTVKSRLHKVMTHIRRELKEFKV